MKTAKLLTLLFAVIFFAACAGDKKEGGNSASAPPVNAQEAADQVQQAMKDAKLQQPAEPVNFRILQELLPENLSGFNRIKLGGETAGAMNIKISKAEGRYKDGSGQLLHLNILDTGGLGMSMMSAAAWSTMSIDKEDEKGYERTGTLGKYKSYEKFRKSGSDSELSILAENRFIVTASCRGCTMEIIRSAVQALDLNRLSQLK